jgi:DNA-binding transcriptional ArsR family regulator
MGTNRKADGQCATSDVRVIDDAETLRLIADPLRLRLLEAIRQEPRTVTELADLLDLPRTKLYYHVNLLLEHDLIAIDTTRVISGITEKRYRVTAYRLSVDKAILGAPDTGQAPLDVFLSVVLDEVATEIRRSVASGLIELDRTHEDAMEPHSLTIGRVWYQLSDEEMATVRDHYTAFMEALKPYRVLADTTTHAPTPDARDLYELLVAFYPVVPPVRDDS